MNDPADSCRASCSLSPAQLQTRLTAITTILNQNPHRQTATERGRRLTFHASPQLEEQLRHLIALEQRCCRFLDLAIEQRDQTLILTVSGDNNAQNQIAELFGQTHQSTRDAEHTSTSSLANARFPQRR